MFGEYEWPSPPRTMDGVSEFCVNSVILAAYPVRFAEVSLAYSGALCCFAFYQNLLVVKVDPLIPLQAKEGHTIWMQMGASLHLVHGVS